MTDQSKYKEYRKQYYKQYYQKNKAYYDKRNKNRPSTRSNYIGIKIGDTIFCYPTKSTINFCKIKKHDIDGVNIKLVGSK